MPKLQMGSLKKITIISAAIVFLLLSIGFVLFLVGKNYSETILNEVIKRETNGYYQLDFESLDLDLFKGRINVNALKLNADTTKGFRELGLNTIYEIQLDELQIDLESVYTLYLDKELAINSVRVVNPDINMISLGRNKKTKFSFEAGSMYKAISDYLKVLKIDYFRILDGELQYGENQFALGEIDFFVKNLLMDSVSRENQVFYSEQIALEIKNQLFHLPDSIHQITFDKFILSTADSVLSFENLRINPTTLSQVTFEGENEINVYDIHIPRLSFKGIDYVAAYQNNHLIIDELTFEEPTVFIDDESHSASAKKDVDNSLLTLIFKIFGSLDIGKLNIIDAHVDLKIDGTDNYQRFKVEESNIVFYNIHLDTSNYRFDHRFEYFEDIELDIHNYTYLLPDSIHRIAFELLRVNSFESELSFNNVVVSHENDGDKAGPLVDIEIPSLQLRDIDFQRAIANKVLNVGTFETSEALIEVRNTGSSGSKQDVTIKEIYASIAPFFREVSIDQLNLTEFELVLPKKIRFDQIDLKMNDIYFNSTSASFRRLFESADLAISGFTLDQDSVTIDGSRLLVSDRMSSFQFFDWQIGVDEEMQKVSGVFDTLQITGVEIDSVIDGNYTTFERALLVNPDFEFNILSKSREKQTKLGIEKELIISGGKLKGKIDSLEMSVEDLEADVFIGDSTAFRSVGIQKVHIKSKELNHVLELEKWMYDTLDNQMEFRGLRIQPINQIDTLKDLIFANVPYMKLTEFQQSQFFDENHLYADFIHLAKPIVKVRKATASDSSANSSESNPFTFNIEKLWLDSANITLLSLTSQLDSLLISDFSSTVFGIDFPQKNPFEKGIFYSDTINLHIGDIIPYLTSGDSLRFKNVSYTSVTSDLEIDSAYLANSERSLILNIPSIQAKNLDVETLYKDGSLHMDSLEILNPSGLNYSIVSGGGKPFVTPLSIDHLKLSNLSWNYTDTINEQKYIVNNGDLAVDYFQSMDTLTVENITDKIERLSFSSGPFDIPLPDNYRVSIDNYQFEFPANNLTLDNVRLKSKFSAQEYTNTLEYQNDWFDVEAKDISIRGIDIDALLKDGRYAMETIALSDLDATIYRDKEVPFPEDQVRHLPQKTIRDIGKAFQIDTISMNGTIRYREKREDYAVYGEISFDDINAQLLNVGNDVSKNELMFLNATGMVMGAGQFEVSGAFNMNAKDETFSLNGSVKEFPLDSMNRMLGPVANVNIKSGYAKSLYFNFSANDELSRGDMRFRYNDLKVQFLNEKTHDTQGLGQGLKTFFANTFVVRSRNPSYLLFLRKGTIFEKRDTSRAIFNYWGKSLLSGVVSSIGVHKSDKAEKKFERRQEQDTP